MIGWFSKDLDPVSLYMNKERGLAEDFCKLWLSVLRGRGDNSDKVYDWNSTGKNH